MRIISGHLKGKKLSLPQDVTRPTSDRAREMIFNLLAHNAILQKVLQVKEARVLDLFAGTGSVGFEALSRGAQHVTFVECEPRAMEQLRFFKDALCADLQNQVSFFQTSVLDLPFSINDKFNLVFLDPPYGKDLALPALQQLYEKQWLALESCIILEIEKGESITLPPYYELLLERRCGRANFLFLEVRARDF